MPDVIEIAPEQTQIALHHLTAKRFTAKLISADGNKDVLPLPLALDEEDALTQAELIQGLEAVEVWCDERKIASLPAFFPDDIAPVPDGLCATSGDNTARSDLYELRHRFPHRTVTASLLAECHADALRLAYMFANGAPVEVWHRRKMIGEVQR